MTPLVQSKNDNCFVTCLASILEVSPTVFPNLSGLFRRERLDKVNETLAKYGYCVVKIAYPDKRDISCPRGYAVCAGVSPRNTPHCVVWENGRIVHDPHPSGKGLSNREWLYLLVALDPSKRNR
jgi:hypothetical protein